MNNECDAGKMIKREVCLSDEKSLMKNVDNENIEMRWVC